MAGGFDPTKVRVPGDGPVPAKVMFVGERPGKDEPWANPPRPFVGMAGRELDRYLLMAGLRRDGVYVTNLVKYMAYGDVDPTPDEISEAEDELLVEMLQVDPQVVVPLGAIATRYFLGDVTMEQVQGIPHTAPEFGLFTGATVFPIIHPAAGLHSPDSMPQIVDGFGRLRLLLRGDLERRSDLHPVPKYGRFNGGAGALTNSFIVAIDTEGSRRSPWCLSFSIQEGTAYVVKPDKAKIFGSLLNKQSRECPEYTILLHNSLHDLSVLDTLGVPMGDIYFVDTMVLAYLLCLEPQGLKALAYRHAGMSMSAYEDIVAEADQMLAVEFLYQVATQDWGPAEPYVIVETVKGKLVPKVKKPQGLNRRINRILEDWVKTGAGESTDCRKRWSKVRDDNPALVEAAEVMYGEMPEPTLDDVEPQVAEEYACRDADATLRVYPELWKKVVADGLVEVSRIDHDIIPMVDRMQMVGMPVEPSHFERLADRMSKEMEEIQRDIQRQTGAWINPDSGDQCAALLFDQLGLPWTKLTKSKKRPKCDDKVLEGLAPDYPIARRITDYRERSKIRSSFCQAIVQRMDDDGRVRCNLRITRVSSGRLAANSPNLLAIPVRTELGLQVRGGFIAPEGHVLGTRDLDQIEMREMAHQSEDQFMCEVLNDPKRDIHNETAALMFGIPIGSVDKQRHRYPAKRVGFGVITGITGLGLLDQMKLAGATDWTEDRCDEIIKEWFRIYPGVRTYMEACRTEARRYGFVRDRWGRRRYLPAIHSPIRHVREEAERQSHSFKISASAQGIMKLGMKRAWDGVFRELRGKCYVEPLLQIHDALLWECDNGWAKYVDSRVEYCLTTATQLRVPVLSKGDFGQSWADVK